MKKGIVIPGGFICLHAFQKFYLDDASSLLVEPASPDSEVTLTKSENLDFVVSKPIKIYTPSPGLVFSLVDENSELIGFVKAPLDEMPFEPVFCARFCLNGNEPYLEIFDNRCNSLIDVVELHWHRH